MRLANTLNETPSQTAGPYVHIGLAPGAAGFHLYDQELGLDIAGPDADGERIRVEGLVIDGSGQPVKDVLIEVWQADSHGKYAPSQGVGPGFCGWGRTISDFDTGKWAFDTVKPGSVADEFGQSMAPHINLWIVARGINIGLNTRLYFSDEKNANAQDKVLALIDDNNRRNTLIAQLCDKSQATYRFDIILQGDNETVFFDI